MRSVQMLVLAIVAGLMCPGVGFAQGEADVTGRWEGAIAVMGARLEMAVIFGKAGDSWTAAIDIPQQRAKGLALTNVRVDGAAVHFELPAGPGLAVFEGRRRGDVIEGDFLQSGVKGSFDLARGAALEAKAAAAKAAAAAEPPPYVVEDVTYRSGGITVACTLTRPTAAGRHAAVQLVTGSGPQTRDEEVFGFKVFKVMSDHLTRAGLAVLRCDDRGVGGTGGNSTASTTADFAEDVRAGVAYLRSRPEIDPARVGILGHSEGGLVAPMVAASVPDLAFIVLMSGPGIPGEQVMLSQSSLLGRVAGLTADAIARNQDMQRRLFAASRTGTGWEQLDADMRADVRSAVSRLPEAQRAALGDVEAYAARQAASQLAAVKTPWFKFFLDADPATWLSKTRCPVLVLFGGKDLQVDAAPNRAAVEGALAAAGNRRVRVEVFPDANHLYQKAGTGGVDEYARLEKSFVPGFLDLLSSWILAQPAVVPAAAR